MIWHGLWLVGLLIISRGGGNMKILLLTGRAGSGKDTFCDLAMRSGVNVARHAFADSLKRLAFNAGWDGVKDEKGRRLLIDLGNSIRSYNVNFFADCVASKIEDVHARYPNSDRIIHVVTDFRFANEAFVLEQLFGNCVKTVRIVRDGLDAIDDVSEYGLDDYACDLTVLNNGSMNDYGQSVVHAMEFLYGRDIYAYRQGSN